MAVTLRTLEIKSDDFASDRVYKRTHLSVCFDLSILYLVKL